MSKCATEGCNEHSSVIHEGSFYCDKCMYRDVLSKAIITLDLKVKALSKDIESINHDLRILENIISAIELMR